MVCLDLLEHIDDDVQVIENLYLAVQPAGSLVVKVPAGRWLFGAVDLASGHYRRYSRQTYGQDARLAGNLWRGAT